MSPCWPGRLTSFHSYHVSPTPHSHRLAATHPQALGDSDGLVRSCLPQATIPVYPHGQNLDGEETKPWGSASDSPCGKGAAAQGVAGEDTQVGGG